MGLEGIKALDTEILVQQPRPTADTASLAITGLPVDPGTPSNRDRRIGTAAGSAGMTFNADATAIYDSQALSVSVVAGVEYLAQTAARIGSISDQTVMGGQIEVKIADYRATRSQQRAWLSESFRKASTATGGMERRSYGGVAFDCGGYERPASAAGGVL